MNLRRRVVTVLLAATLGVVVSAPVFPVGDPPPASTENTIWG